VCFENKKIIPRNYNGNKKEKLRKNYAKKY
jgi:hypothetical protein